MAKQRAAVAKLDTRRRRIVQHRDKVRRHRTQHLIHRHHNAVVRGKADR